MKENKFADLIGGISASVSKTKLILMASIFRPSDSVTLNYDENKQLESVAVGVILPAMSRENR